MAQGLPTAPLPFHAHKLPVAQSRGELDYVARAIATSHRLGEMDALNHAPDRR